MSDAVLLHMGLYNSITSIDDYVRWITCAAGMKHNNVTIESLIKGGVVSCNSTEHAHEFDGYWYYVNPTNADMAEAQLKEYRETIAKIDGLLSRDRDYIIKKIDSAIAFIQQSRRDCSVMFRCPDETTSIV